MSERFDSVGFEGWSKYEILEFMLFYVMPRVNTNEIAHDLLDFSCGNIVDLLNDACEYDKLKCINKIGDKTIWYLRALKEFINYYRHEELKHKRIRVDRDSFREIVNAIGMSKDRENIYMICLDRELYIKNILDLTVGSDMYGATTEVDRIVRLAAGSKSENIVLLHNHPSGNPKISKEDIVFTERVGKMLETLNIFLVDHYIVAGDKIVSIKMSS